MFMSTESLFKKSDIPVCQICEMFQLLRQKVLKPSKSAVFPRNAQKNTLSTSAKSVKNRRGRKMYLKNTP